MMLIDDLVEESSVITAMKPPTWYFVRLAATLLLYVVAIMSALGIRPDFAAQLTRPEFIAELLLLLTITVTSMLAAVHLAYPDLYQRRWLLFLPLMATAAFVVLMMAIAAMPSSKLMVIEREPLHFRCLLCTACIGALAIIPAAVLMFVQRRGATVQPMLAGIYAVLAATAMSCVMLRLEEATDSIVHLVVWHYLPTLCFAAIGAWLGKRILHW